MECRCESTPGNVSENEGGIRPALTRIHGYMDMACWYLQILGAPLLTRLSGEQTEEVHFRYHDTWLLLASLALETQVKRREALIHRFALDDQQTGRQKLRMRLHDLRHGAPIGKNTTKSFCGIGPECLLTDGEGIALAPGTIRTDLQELEEVLEEVATLTTAQERIACLKRGAALLRGSVLDGFAQPTQDDPWLETLRFRADRLAAELWLLLAQELDTKGERRSAFDAARKAYTLSPENPETLELLLGLAEGVRERDEVLQLSKQLGVEGLLSRLEVLEKEGQSLTVTEEQALLEAVKTRLKQLSQKVVAGLLAVSGFPQDFTVEQAQAICGVSGETLERMAHAFPMSKEKGQGQERYGLLPALRVALQSQLSLKEKRLFREKHATYYLGAIQVPGVLVSTWCAEPANLALAAAWYLEEPPLRQGLVYLQQYWHEAGGYPTTVDATQQCRMYLKNALEELAPGDAVLAAELLGRLALKFEDFTEALHWFRVSVVHFGATHYHLWRDLLIAAHHAAQDEIFDEVIQSFFLENKQFWECTDIMYHIAENQMARRHFIVLVK